MEYLIRSSAPRAASAGQGLFGPERSKDRRMEHLFTEKIQCWEDWGRIYQSIPAFEKLVRHIFEKEGLPRAQITHLTPGTNAVFRVGDYVAKIFAPAESGMDQTDSRRTELFAAKFARDAGVPIPGVEAFGEVRDRYSFAYIIMKYTVGRELGEELAASGRERQFLLGRALRALTDAMNVPCAPFNRIHVIDDPDRSRRWKTYTEAFLRERKAYLAGAQLGEFVFTHGDLCADNVLVGENGELVVIDFADAVLAPGCYEPSLLLFEYGSYPAFLQGYWEGEDPQEVAGEVFTGILIHDFGGDIVKGAFPGATAFGTVEELRERISQRLSAILQKN